VTIFCPLLVEREDIIKNQYADTEKIVTGSFFSNEHTREKVCKNAKFTFCKQKVTFFGFFLARDAAEKKKIKKLCKTKTNHGVCVCVCFFTHKGEKKKHTTHECFLHVFVLQIV